MNRADDVHPQLAELHRRLLAGEGKAAELLAELVFEDLVRELKGADPAAALDAVTDAWVDYVTRPASYKPSRGVPLDRFLLLAARRNLSNLKLSEARRRKREQQVADAHKEKLVDLNTPARNLEEREETEARQTERERLMAAFPDPKDRKMLALKLGGTRATKAFAEALEITHLPEQEQKAHVKRAKDRIDKALRRLRRD